MINGRKLLALSLAGTVFLSPLAGCGRGDGAADGGAFNMRVCVAAEPATIDPCLNSSLDGAILTQHIFEGLLRWSDSGVPVEGADNANLAALSPGQAEGYDKVDNGDGTVTYTFHLREGIQWSDGRPVTADDFVYAWRRLASHSTAADYCYMIDMVKGYADVNTGTPVLDANGNPTYVTKGADNRETVVEGLEFDADGALLSDLPGGAVEKRTYADPSALGVSAPDDRTFVVELTYDCPYFLEICAFPATLPVRRDIIEAHGDQWTFSPDTYIGNGQYKLVEWAHNARIVLEKNPEYYGYREDVGPDRLTFMLMDDGNAQLSAFRSGGLDFIETVPVDEIPALLASGALSVVSYIGTYYVSYNTAAPPFDDWRVRKAFTLAIDSQYIVDYVTQTGQIPATGFVPAGISDADPDGADFRAAGGDYWPAPATPEQYAANVAQARQLLADAGYPDGAGFPTVTYLYDTNDNHKAIGEALQNQWKTALNVDVKLENQDWSVFLESRKQGDYQVARNGWIADYNDPISFLDMWVTGSGNNDAQYANPAYDAAVAQAKATSDPAERMAAMHRAEDILMEQDWVLGPIYFYTQKYMLSDGISGLYYTPLGYFFFGNCTRD